MGKHHSWAVCGWGIADGLIKLGHEVHIYSTDGIAHFPSRLKNNLIGYNEENQTQIFGRKPDHNYDYQISYTAMKNFPYYLDGGKRIGIWCFEWAGKNVLPTGFAKHYKSCDKLCPPTNFAKQIFIDSGVPESCMKVVPHGINAEQYRGTSTIDLKIDKKIKILVNIAQNHKRKNIPGLLEAYGKAFTNKDDVCLILKGKEKKVSYNFEVSLNECLANFKKKYPNHAQIKVYNEFIEDMSVLYRSIDVVYSLTLCEGYYIPALESLASGKINIAPNWGGQLDFLNKDNALLVEGKEERADPSSMYWESKNNAIWFRSNTDDAADKLRYAYNNYQELNDKLEKNKEYIYSKYDWSNIAKEYLI